MQERGPGVGGWAGGSDRACRCTSHSLIPLKRFDLSRSELRLMHVNIPFAAGSAVLMPYWVMCWAPPRGRFPGLPALQTPGPTPWPHPLATRRSTLATPPAPWLHSVLRRQLRGCSPRHRACRLGFEPSSPGSRTFFSTPPSCVTEMLSSGGVKGIGGSASCVSCLLSSSAGACGASSAVLCGSSLRVMFGSEEAGS